MLEVKNLTASVNGKIVLANLSLTIPDSEIAALMGPNAAGKSTLAHIVAGDPRYKAESGEIIWNGKNLLNIKPEERAAEGIFITFQNPPEISGVNLQHFLWSVCKKRSEKLQDFTKRFAEALVELKFDRGFAGKDLNMGSGGEKKRMEILQMLMLRPRFAIFDEIDSGVDVDSLRVIGAAINKMRQNGFSALIITHHGNILQHTVPDSVHIILDGNVAISGKKELALEVETKGYGWLKRGD